MTKKRFCVYKHTCPNEKVYIGITCQNPIKRWKGGSGYQNNKHFYSAILKYGWDNIKHEILFDSLTEEEAKEMEIKLISKYQSNDRKFGYNNTSGGDGVRGYNHNEDIRAKMRDAKRKNQHCVLQIDVKTNECVAKYANLMEAERQTKINHVSINYCCRGKRKTSGGYKWQYEDEPHNYDPLYTKSANMKRGKYKLMS